MRFQNSKGFTLVEILVVGAVVGLVILAASQMTIAMFTFTKKMEQQVNAAQESAAIDATIMKSIQNINFNRFDYTETFVRSGSSTPTPLANVKTGTIPAFSVPVALWKQGGGGILFQKVNTLVLSDPGALFLSSFELEEYKIISKAGGLAKQTKKINIARCDLLENYFEFNEAVKFPGTTALYVLYGMKRRPFMKFDANGKALLSCCPVTQPNCTDGAMLDSYFRVYTIFVDSNSRVIAVEDFPKQVQGSSILGGGFGIYLQNSIGSTISLETFSIETRCGSMTVKRNECNSIDSVPNTIKNFKSASDIVNVVPKSIKLSPSSEIVNTGVISL